jgi:hypothetical protein
MFKTVRAASVFFLVFATASPAIAGLFSTALSADDAAQLKHVAVVSSLGDILHASQVGVTVFGNKAFDASVSNWALDASMRTYLLDKIVASGRINGSVEPLVTPTAEQKSILALAREGNFDTVVALVPFQNLHDPRLPTGPGLLRRKLPGVDKLYACNSMVMRIWRVNDGKQIGYSFVDPCTKEPIAGVWHDNWNEFTDEEKRSILDLVRSFAEQQILIALRAVRLPPP